MIVSFTPSELERIEAFLGSHYAFRPLGWTPTRSEYVWPIEEYLARTRHGRKVRERIQRLNPNGKPEASWPRGWHPHKRAFRWERDCMSVRDFVRRYGTEEYRALPRRALIRDGHRKGVAMTCVVERGRR